MIKQFCQLSAVNKMHPIFDAMVCGQFAYDFAQIDPSVIKRMRFKHKMVLRWRAIGESLKHHIQKFLCCVKRRMVLHGCIMLQLQHN